MIVVLVLVGLITNLSILSHSAQATLCIRNETTNPFSTADALVVDTEDLDVLLYIAKSFRENFFTFSSLDYTRLRNDITNIYNGVFTFNDRTFISTALYYCKDAEYLAAFVLIAAVCLPCLLFSLWLYWEKCYVSIEEEIENKYISLTSQLLSWFLGISVCVCMLCIGVFTVILLVGNERVGVTVDETKTLIAGTLPMVVDLHEEFLTSVNRTLVTEYKILNDSIYENELNYLSRDIRIDINKTYYEQINSLINNISDSVSDIDSVFERMLSLADFHGNISNISDSVADDIMQLVEFCNSNEVNSENVTNDLIDLCQELLTNTTTYLPLPSSSFPNLTQLLEIIDIMRNVVDIASLSSVQERKKVYNAFLYDLERNVSVYVFPISSSFLNSLKQNLSNIVDNIHSQYSNITYGGYPDSQELVENALGEEYLSNWQEFWNLATISFCLSLFVLVLGIFLAVGRGLLNIGSIYMYGCETVYVSGAHQAALMLKSFAVWVSVVGVVSAFFFVFIMCVASLVGRTCGIHQNYTEIIDDVIDNNNTWGGEYPLGTTYHYNSSYPLTIHSVIILCSKNSSSLEALQLQDLLYIDVTMMKEQEVVYIEKMKNVVEFLSTSYSVLGTSLESAILQYQSVSLNSFAWSAYNDSERLFEESFVGLEELRLFVNEMMSEVSNISLSIEEYNISTILQNIEYSILLLEDLEKWYNLSYLETNATFIVETLEQVNNISDFVYTASKLEKNIIDYGYSLVVKTTSVEAATNVTTQVQDFVTTAEYTLSCDTSLCYPLSETFANYSVTVCSNLLNGLDVHWITLAVLFIIIIPSLLLMILLASQLSDSDTFMSQRKNRSQHTFSMIDQILSQLVGTSWFILIICVDVWFVVSMATDDLFARRYCTSDSRSCCVSCVWISGIIFVIISFCGGFALRIYQWILLHRIKAYNGPRVSHVQRTWLPRIKAALFYNQLSLFFLLYVPFLGISGSYITSRGILTAASFASLFLSLLGIFSFLLLLLQQRGQVMDHVNLVQQCLSVGCLKRNAKYISSNGDVGRVDEIPMTTIDPQGRVRTDSDHTSEYDDEDERGVTNIGDSSSHPLPSPPPPPSSFPSPPPPPNSEEAQEEETVNEVEEIPSSIPHVISEPLEMYQLPHAHNPMSYDGEEEIDIIEGGIDEDEGIEQITSVYLDRVLSDADLLKQRQREAAMAREKGGVKVAPQYLSQYTDDGSTPRSSLYLSGDSMAGSEVPTYFYSSTNIPGYSTDDSSKDGYDSDYRYYPPSEGKHVVL